MPKLGIVSDEQLNNELVNCNIVDKPQVTFVHREVGRGKGNVQVPDGLRKIIGEESIINGRDAALELAKDFGVSPSSVSAYAKGATSTATINTPDSTLQNYLTSRKNRASKHALRKLNLALDSITPDKLTNIKAKDLSSIAKDMSVVAKNMEPPNTNEAGGNRPNFVVYAPTIRDERSYETVIVNDNY